MATRKVYLKIKMEIYNPSVIEISNDDINRVVAETNYKFESVDGFELETEISECEIIE